MSGLLEDGIRAHAFPGAALIVTHKGRIALEHYCGRLTYDDDSQHVNAETVFDLASLTKVMVTTPLAMQLVEQRKLRLQHPVVSRVPEFAGADARRASITFEHLLAHSSGLPAHKKYYEHARDAASVLRLIFETPLEAEPGTRTEYSDVGFILIGVAIERMLGAGLDILAHERVLSPLGLACSFGPLTHVTNVAPTLEAVDFRDRRICGQVNDENAWVMGGIAGHAGLFGTARDVAKFALAMLSHDPKICSRQTLEVFTRRQMTPPGTSRALGWDTPSAPSQSGRYLSPQSFGHLGYTGTSLWIDPERDLSITLLTNRTYPDNSSQEIKRCRPLIHDAAIESLGLP